MKRATIFTLLTISSVWAADIVHRRPTEFEKGRPFEFATMLGLEELAPIKGIEDATKGQFPYQVGLEIVHGSSKFWCSGALIADQWILTTAHCVHEACDVIAHFSATNRTDLTEANYQQISIPEANLIVHEEYDESTLTNDIALLRLPSPVEQSEFVAPVKLPSSAERESYAKAVAVTSGWGQISYKLNKVADKLRWINLTLLDLKTCGFYYKDGLLKEHNICVDSTSGKTVCNGDSGSPLVLDETKELIGIASFGLRLGCDWNYPVAYVSVADYLEWIVANTQIVV